MRSRNDTALFPLTLLLALALVVLCARAQQDCASGFNPPCTEVDKTTPYCVTISQAGGGFCRPCLPSNNENLGQCDCPLGHYCSAASAPFNTYGYCQPYTLLGKDCADGGDCITEAISNRGFTEQNEVLQCHPISKTCQPCTGAGDPQRCPGWPNDVPGSAYPGLTYQCLANGTMTVSGSIDYSYGLTTPTASRRPGSSASRTPTPSLSFGASPSTTPAPSDAGIATLDRALLMLMLAAVCALY